jgi:hypothetical protein
MSYSLQTGSPINDCNCYMLTSKKKIVVIAVVEWRRAQHMLHADLEL